MDTNNYKRIAKNAGLLYFRMLLTMAVTLYTSRVVLNTLGVDDFGIYHLVGGFITMLGFLHGAMSSATQRFISFELGKTDNNNLNNIFSMSINIHLLIAAGIFLLGETVGIWFVTTHLTIPTARMEAACWVFHLSLLAFLVSVISVPYNAIIIAHERMSVFAWVSIVDVSLKLLIVFMLSWFGMDKLMLYAALMLAVISLVTIVYKLYCKSRFPESRFRLYWNKPLFNTMLSYTGWNMWGNAAAVMGSQGVNVMLNIFFGPTINAARTIAFQVSGALNSFVQNVQIAVNPQIIKSYASNDVAYMHKLVCYGAKYNFFLLFFLSFPVLLKTEQILVLWLGNVPSHTIIFVQLVIINILIDTISYPLITAAQATGKIKTYQTVVGGILLLNLPLSYLLLKNTSDPSGVLLVSIAVSILALFARLKILQSLIGLPLKKYLLLVIGRSGLVAVSSVMIIFLLEGTSSETITATIVVIVISSVWTIFCITIFGLDKQERAFLSDKIIQLVNQAH
ncbi:hypothetical protein [Pseudomonas fluorescens]|uniref:hypothetical protein n=1 Tax=Pseudomonas fluorescens TaxID=294 RepID=UPI001258A251|nr:hypothetical protein [Pseudomonas fluorescens]VVM73689.1 hypothetical protein PS639_01907 [Pseudomonas fluorescens]